MLLTKICGKISNTLNILQLGKPVHLKCSFHWSQKKFRFAAHNRMSFSESCDIPIRRNEKISKLLSPLLVTKKPLLHFPVKNSQPLFLQFPAPQQSSWWRCSSFLFFMMLLSLFPLQKKRTVYGRTHLQVTYLVFLCIQEPITAARFRLTAHLPILKK